MILAYYDRSTDVEVIIQTFKPPLNHFFFYLNGLNFLPLSALSTPLRFGVIVHVLLIFADFILFFSMFLQFF